MGKLIIDQFMTLDGVVQAPGGPEEDSSDGFAHGGWQFGFSDDELGDAVLAETRASEAMLLGRRTYEIFASYWPNAAADDPFAKKLNAMPKYVASRSLTRVAWQNSTLLGPDLAREVAGIKARHGEVHVVGSGNLAQSLMRERLVDRFNLWIYPLVLGTGKRLFADGAVPTALHLVRSRTFKSGALQLTYDPSGKPRYGTASSE